MQVNVMKIMIRIQPEFDTTVVHMWLKVHIFWEGH